MIKIVICIPIPHTTHVECVVGIQKKLIVGNVLEMANYQRKRYVVMKFIHDEEHIVFKDIGKGKRRKEVFNGGLRLLLGYLLLLFII